MAGVQKLYSFYQEMNLSFLFDRYWKWKQWILQENLQAEKIWSEENELNTLQMGHLKTDIYLVLKGKNSKSWIFSTQTNSLGEKVENIKFLRANPISEYD